VGGAFILLATFAGSGFAQSARLSVGDVAPRIVLREAGGERIDSRSFAGKVYVVDFWSPFCAPCRGAVPWLNTAHRELEAHGGAVLGVMAGRAGASDVAEAVREWHMRFVVGAPFMPGQADRSDGYGVRRLPATFVVGSDGRVAAAFYRMPSESQLLAAVRSTLAAGDDG
jgi:peroxiredoxin